MLLVLIVVLGIIAIIVLNILKAKGVSLPGVRGHGASAQGAVAAASKTSEQPWVLHLPGLCQMGQWQWLQTSLAVSLLADRNPGPLLLRNCVQSGRKLLWEPREAGW